MLPERQSRPGENRTARDVSDDAVMVPLINPQALAHGHAVLVSTPSGRWSRRDVYESGTLIANLAGPAQARLAPDDGQRLYLSLHSADKAMQRAQDRGQTAHCVLVELVPVPGSALIVVGGDDR